MSAEKPLKVNQIEALFTGDLDMPTRDEIRACLNQLGEDYANRGYELKQVASGFRIQVRQDYADWVGRLWEEKPARYTRALLETMALIAYRQPITRGEIEDVRGVSVSSNIIKTLMEREWIKVLGHKDVPGKPALYGTTRAFLDYFNLKSLDELPTLAEIKDLDQIHQELDLDIDNTGAAGADEESAAGDEESAADDDDEDKVTPIAAAPSADEDESGQGEAGDDTSVVSMAAPTDSEDVASEDDEHPESEAVDKDRMKVITAAIDDVEIEEDFAEAEAQSAAS